MFSDTKRLQANALKSAQQFIGTSDSLTVLGWGVSGFVFAAPDFQSAIKVHHTSEPHGIEVKAYKRLKQHKITSLLGLTIPRLKKSDPVRHLIQIDLVSAPFLLDFAGVTFSKPDFSPETIAEHYEVINQRFGKNAHIAYGVYYALAKIGMYYLDLRPSNLNLNGLPNLEPNSEEEDVL